MAIETQPLVSQLMNCAIEKRVERGKDSSGRKEKRVVREKEREVRERRREGGGRKRGEVSQLYNKYSNSNSLITVQ